MLHQIASYRGPYVRGLSLILCSKIGRLRQMLLYFSLMQTTHTFYATVSQCYDRVCAQPLQLPVLTHSPSRVVVQPILPFLRGK
jgi:hypothetical protein